MFSRASTVLLSCGLLCAAAGDFSGQGIQAESRSKVKPAWEHVGPGLAGVMAPVAANPLGSGALYIATMAGGVRRSLDNGETWATVNNGLANRATSALAVDAAGPQSLYVGTVGGGAYKSDDGGESWHAHGRWDSRTDRPPARCRPCPPGRRVRRDVDGLDEKDGRRRQYLAGGVHR